MNFLEKILEIDVDNVDDLFECYNKKKISRELIKYMINYMPKLKRNDTLKVVINNKIKGNVRCGELIKQALDEACIHNDSRFYDTTLKQIWFLILGVIFLLISYVIDVEILKEIIIIGAWVLLWDVVEMEIVDDINNRKKRRILKKILSSEFVENIK